MSEIDAAERETPYHDELTPYRSEAVDLVSYVVWSNNSTDDHEEPWRRIAKAILAARKPLIDALEKAQGERDEAISACDRHDDWRDTAIAERDSARALLREAGGVLDGPPGYAASDLRARIAAELEPKP